MKRHIRPVPARDVLTQDAGAQNILMDAWQTISKPYIAATRQLPAPMRTIIGHHTGRWSCSGAVLPGRGKAVRPALVLESARGLGDERSLRAAVPLAVAIELVHDFTLLHDDIIDADPLRRHRSAAWVEFGIPQALLTGDVLLSLAFGEIDSASARALLGADLVEACAGVNTELSLQTRDHVGIEESLAVATAKTGALLGCACALGAVAAGADGERIGAMRAFGRHIGQAFQLIDDELGLWGETETIGKPAHTDLLHRRRTVPVVVALASRTPEAELLSEFYRRAEPPDHDDLAHMAALVTATGARRWIKQRAQDEMRAALVCLKAARPSGPIQNLYAIAQSIVARNR